MTDRAEPGMPPDLPNILQGAMPNSTETQSLPEVPAPMLDVHAPQESIHSWKGFAIHIATVTIGLLIAIGLEQTVEYFHHRHQVAEMMGKLRRETFENREILLTNIKETDRSKGRILRFHRALDAPLENFIYCAVGGALISTKSRRTPWRTI